MKKITSKIKFEIFNKQECTFAEMYMNEFLTDKDISIIDVQEKVLHNYLFLLKMQEIKEMHCKIRRA